MTGPDGTSAAVRLGTRGSALAVTQSGHVAAALTAAAELPEGAVELVRIRTEGDRLTGSLAALGGAGVFVAALREAVLDGRCDVAVHSLKDIPTAPADGLTVVAVPEREDPRDALCARDGLRLADLPRGARVGTGSPRRAAQLLAARPDLDVVDIRGNVDTRLGRVPGTGPDGTTTGPGDLDAVVLAAAGLARLGRLDVVTELLDPGLVAPAPGQGALAVECRAGFADGDSPVARGLRSLDHRPTRLAVTAERALLATLEAGCAAPVGTLARLDGDELVLDAVVAAPGGVRTVRASAGVTLPVDPTDPAEAGPGADERDRPTETLIRAATDAEVAAAEHLGADVARMLLDGGVGELAPLGPRQGVGEPGP